MNNVLAQVDHWKGFQCPIKTCHLTRNWLLESSKQRGTISSYKESFCKDISLVSLCGELFFFKLVKVIIYLPHMSGLWLGNYVEYSEYCDFILFFVLMSSTVFWPGARTNFALLRPATQSSTCNYADFPAQFAVEGALDDWFCAISDLGDFSPWWKVELAHPIWVTHVKLTNRRLFGRLEYSFPGT